VYAHLHHGGDYAAAARQLAARGYQAEPARVRGTTPVNGRSGGPSRDGSPPQGDCPDAAELKGWTHDELLDHVFPPLRWLLDGLVPDSGLTMLGGKKKLGKSWLCMQIAQAVASGLDTLGKRVARGRVAYICLEDGGRRLQDRLMKQHSAHGLPITWYAAFPKLDRGGMETLKAVAAPPAGEKPRLIVLDTFAAAKSGRLDENAAGPMADLANALRELAQESGTGFLFTHHHGKVVGGDPGDDLRGSSALAAAADVNLGLYRVEDGYRLKGEGRDIEPFDYAVRFDVNGQWKWLMIGDARVIAQEEADHQVLLALSTLGEADAEAVAEFINKSKSAAGDRLRALAAAQRVLVREVPVPRGRPRILYRLPPADALPDESPF
jgi:hypothetical protein